MEFTILVVDDDTLVRNSLKREFSSDSRFQNCRILEARRIAEALNIVRSEPIHVMILDRDLSGEGDTLMSTGIEAIPEFLSYQPNTQIIVFTGSRDVEDILSAARAGAFWYGEKSHPVEVLKAQVEKALTHYYLQVGSLGVQPSDDEFSKLGLVGHSKAIRQLKERLRAVAESTRPVLLLGESGVGKTTVAKAIHEYRKAYLKKSNRPFCHLNLTTLSPQLFERELFGHEKGAYTGAYDRKQGFLELANQGTLFLDEIGEITPDIQVKLLNVIEDGKFVRVGGTKELQADFKLICATNKDLDALVAQEAFREDLYMRISTFVLTIPPIRERTEDIPDLIEALLPKIRKETRIAITMEDIPSDFIRYLQENPPRGNIRGLDHQLNILVTYAPKDGRGRPILSKWRSIPELRKLNPTNAKAFANGLTLQDIQNSDFNVLGPDFPGFQSFIQLITQKIFNEASKKFARHKDIAKALKISEGSVSIKMRGFFVRKIVSPDNTPKATTNRKEEVQQ